MEQANEAVMTDERLLVVTGGLRVGDTFRLGNTLLEWSREELEKGSDGIDLLCTSYTAGVVQYFLASTEIAAKRMFVIHGGQPEPFDWNAVDAFRAAWAPALRTENIRWLESIELISPGPFKGGLQNIKLEPEPETPFIIVQADSVSAWKRVPSLYEVEFPYPVISVGFPGEQIIPSTKFDMRGAPWLVIMGLLQRCAFWVGIDSALFNAAVFIRKPGLCVHFGDGLPGVEDYSLGVDLVNPSKMELQTVVDRMVLNASGVTGEQLRIVGGGGR